METILFAIVVRFIPLEFNMIYLNILISNLKAMTLIRQKLCINDENHSSLYEARKQNIWGILLIENPCQEFADSLKIDLSADFLKREWIFHGYHLKRSLETLNSVFSGVWSVTPKTKLFPIGELNWNDKVRMNF